MKAWILAAGYLAGTALLGQTYAGLGFGVTTGAGLYAEHYIHPKWSLEANIGIPAVGFGVNYVLHNSRRVQLGRVHDAQKLFRRGQKGMNSGRLTAGVTITGAILPDVGLFQYRFWNLGLHKTIRKTDFGMELGLMRGAIVTGPSGSTYPQPFISPGIQFTLGRSLFEPGPLKRLKQRVQNL
jgi:hypothetical protein